MEACLPIAVLFMVLLVFNAAFNLFCGLCAACIVWRDLVAKPSIETTIKNGVYRSVEDANGIRHLVTDDDLKEAVAKTKEFDQWLMMT